MDVVGKTIESLELTQGDYAPGIVFVEIKFTDGSRINITARGCDEGGWMEVDAS